MRRYVQGIALLVALLRRSVASCRRQQPSLIDRNQPPDTQLWYAPPDSSDYEYKVHMYWRGIDTTAPRSDSSGPFRTPSRRRAELESGAATARLPPGTYHLEDRFRHCIQGYRNASGVGVRKNRQAFFVAAIDDNGVIDPATRPRWSLLRPSGTFR
jgi:hypothetical protein